MNILENFKQEITSVNNEINRLKFNKYYEALQNHNLLIMGIRQIDKSAITKQLAYKYISDKQLKKEEFLNLDLRSFAIKDDFLEIIYNLSKTIKLVVIDEIQFLNNWKNEMQVIIDKYKDVKFIFTGSNSLFLRTNNFVGRAIQYVMNPLSFNEFKIFWNKSFSDYLIFGSFPKANNNISLAVQNSRLSEQIIKDVAKEDIGKKINFDKFFFLTKNILNYIGNEVKMSSSYNDLDIDHRTGKKYLDILINTQILKIISNK